MRDLNLQQKLCQILADGEFHSGSEMAAQLNVSRTTVWNHLRQLQGMGLRIDGVNGRGQRAVNGIDLLDRAQLSAALPGTHVHIAWQLPSTNTELKNRLAAAAEHSGWQLCSAEIQTAGRGRRGRDWVSGLTSHLCFSLGRNLDVGLTRLGGASIVVGLSIAKVLQAAGVEGVKLKWPNDVRIEGQKLAGILVEAQGQANEKCQLVIGVGLNVRLTPEQVAQIDQPCTDVTQQLHQPVSRTRLLASLVYQIQQDLDEYLEQGLTPYLNSWNALDETRDKPVTLLLPQKEINGLARGITPTGDLRVETAEGLQIFSAGEISLRRQ